MLLIGTILYNFGSLTPYIEKIEAFMCQSVIKLNLSKSSI